MVQKDGDDDQIQQQGAEQLTSMMRQCAADDPAVVQPRNRTAASPVAL